MFSENRGWGFIPTVAVAAPATEAKYGSKRLVIIGNRGWECHFGINLRSSDDGAQPSTLIAWNVFHDCCALPVSPMSLGTSKPRGRACS